MQGKSIAVPKSTCSFTVTIKVLRKLYAFYFSLINLGKKNLSNLPSLAIKRFAGVPCVCETYGAGGFTIHFGPGYQVKKTSVTVGDSDLQARVWGTFPDP